MEDIIKILSGNVDGVDHGEVYYSNEGPVVHKIAVNGGEFGALRLRKNGLWT